MTEQAKEHHSLSVEIMKVDGPVEIPLPFKAHPDDAGFDLRSSQPSSIRIPPGKSALIPTGYAWAIPEQHVGLVSPKSGMAAKHRITVGNAPGIIDASYRGELCVILHNEGDMDYRVDPGDKIAQLVIVPTPDIALMLTDRLSATARGTDGFGSTGI